MYSYSGKDNIDDKEETMMTMMLMLMILMLWGTGCIQVLFLVQQLLTATPFDRDRVYLVIFIQVNLYPGFYSRSCNNKGSYKKYYYICVQKPVKECTSQSKFYLPYI